MSFGSPEDQRKRASFRAGFDVLRRSLRPITDEDYFHPEVPTEPLSRRRLIRDPSKEALKHGASILGDSWDLIQDIVNFSVDRMMSRRKMMISSFILTVAAAGVIKVLSENPNLIPDLIQDARLAPKLGPVWSELQELSKPLSNSDLLGMLHNPYKKIELTAEEAATVKIVGNADSEYLKDGVRHNHFGYAQPDSWIAFSEDKLNAGLEAIGVTGQVTSANYAQPGASSEGLIGHQKYAGNVQLGALTVDDMTPDLKGEIPPRQMMIDHEGTLIATVGLHGDDMRDTADLVLGYIREGGPKYDREFADFIRNPSRNTLTDHTADVLVECLNSYKRDKDRIKTNFAKALDIYRDIYAQRKGRGKMHLVVTQPLRLDEAESAPYAPLDAERGVTGKVNIKDYGQGGKMAGLLVTVPFYQIERDLLARFEADTGVQVTSLPFLDLSGRPELCADDGHFNRDGQNEVANLFMQLFNISHPDSPQQLRFTREGGPLLMAA